MKTPANKIKKKGAATAAVFGLGVLGLLGVLLFSGDANASEPAQDDDDGPKPDVDTPRPDGDLPSVDDLPEPETDPLGPDPKPPGRGSFSPDFVAPGGGDGGAPDDLSPNPPPPVGPDPSIDQLPDFYNDAWPDPGKFYQVTGRDSRGLFSIAYEWHFTCLFLAARNAGGLSVEDARQWAEERVGPEGSAQGEAADYILCVAWNDITHGSNVVAAKNRRGPHGRGIDLVPQHAANWDLIRSGQSPVRNVEIGQPGAVGTPSNVGEGSARLPLLWMPRLDDKALWDSDGVVMVAAGNWADDSSFFFPPPVVMELGVDDPTDAGLGVWGCGQGEDSWEVAS